MIVNRKNRTRKIIGNLIVAYIVFPLLYLNNSWRDLLNKNYTDGYNQFSSIWEFLDRKYGSILFFSIVLLIGCLLPFQLIKNYYLYKKEKYYFLKSLGIYILYNILFVLVSGYGFLLLTSILSPFTDFLFPMPFIITLIIFSAIVQSCLYLIVDRYFRKGNNP
jgi:hypothetical protein